MKSVLPTLSDLRPNPLWSELPLFDRTGWKRVRFGDVVENCAETCDPESAGLERFVAMEHLEPGSLHVRSWGNVADGTTFTRRCRPGQVLFGKRRAYQRKVAVAEFEAVVSGDIDAIVKEVRFPDWQNTSGGQREVQKALRAALRKFQLHTDQELFDKSYGYIREYY